jgi:hypothetical protein
MTDVRVLAAIRIPDMDVVMSNSGIDSILLKYIDFGHFRLWSFETPQAIEPKSRPNTRALWKLHPCLIIAKCLNKAICLSINRS